jgi:threonine synthase
VPVADWVRVCRRCGRGFDLSAAAWRCPCGGLFDLQGPRADPLGAVDGQGGPWSLWRYRSTLPVPTAGDASAWQRVSLGEGMTPLVPAGPGLWCKLDQIMPTRSFKDRGAAVMLALAAGLGVEKVVVDSSGNAGRAVAAYAARAGMEAAVFVPEETAAAKRAAIEAYGARVVTVAGDRAAAARAARDAADTGGMWYASHVYRPEFVHGVKTLAFELCEQLAGVASPASPASPAGPAAVVVPAGNGTLVLGLWAGFRELVAAGRARRVPPIVAVQAENCAPLAGRGPCRPTAATGIAIADPPRGGEVRAAVIASGGRVLTVPEASLEPARLGLARLGIAVEPTSAAVWAARGLGGWPTGGWPPSGTGRGAGGGDAPVVLVLTGA